MLAEDDAGIEPLLDRMIDKWSGILGSVHEEEKVPDDARRDWCKRLVGVNFLDPKARTALREMSSEIDDWHHQLTRGGFQIAYRVRELADMCVEYQRASAE